jgi:hypothetical protein
MMSVVCAPMVKISLTPPLATRWRILVRDHAARDHALVAGTTRAQQRDHLRHVTHVRCRQAS